MRGTAIVSTLIMIIRMVIIDSSLSLNIPEPPPAASRGRSVPLPQQTDHEGGEDRRPVCVAPGLRLLVQLRLYVSRHAHCVHSHGPVRQGQRLPPGLEGVASGGEDRSRGHRQPGQKRKSSLC